MLAQRLQQRLSQRPVGASGAGRYRPPGQHRHAVCPCLGGQLTGQPGLADSRLAGEEHDRARAIPGRRERRPQRVSLRPATYDYRAQQVRHQISMLHRAVGSVVMPSATCADTCSHARARPLCRFVAAAAQHRSGATCAGFVFPPMRVILVPADDGPGPAVNRRRATTAEREGNGYGNR
jgi:hypothetical protein